MFLVDRDLAAAEETRRLIAAEGGAAVALACDVTSSAECLRMVDACLGAFGSIDVLHNNVGITIPGGPVELAEEDWDRVMRVNLKSMFLTCKHVLPQMDRQGRGAIVNIASHNAVRSLPVIAIAYAASKAAIIAMTREVAMQYAAQASPVHRDTARCPHATTYPPAAGGNGCSSGKPGFFTNPS